MDYSVKNILILRKILWIDALAGCITAIIGLIFFYPLSNLLGLTTTLIVSVSIVTLLYGIVAFILVKQDIISIDLLRALVYANWLWTLISMTLFFIHFGSTKTFGLIFLILQVLVVGGLAYLEGNQIERINKL